MAHRILLVEDDLHTRRILKTLLMTEKVLSKAEIVEAGEGSTALAELDRGEIHLIVTDLMMPGMDGIEFCTRLRQHSAGKTVPVIIMSSGVSNPADIDRMKAEFDAEFFAKPFEVRAIMRAMVRALSEGRPANTAVADPGAPSPAAASAAVPSAPASARAVPPAASAPAPQSAAPSEAATRRIVAAARAGKLNQDSPAALLLDACNKSTTGTLVLLRGNMQKQISLRLGAPVSVDSNLRTETLGHYLIGRGVLNEVQHQEALAMAREQKIQLGQALVQRGWVSEPDLMKHLAAQMKAKLNHVLRWPDGDWQLFSGEPASRGLPLPIDTPSVVFSELRKSAHVDEIAPRYTGRKGRVRLTARGERFRGDFDQVFGAGCVEQIVSAVSVDALTGSGADALATLVQLDTMIVCQLATIEEAAVATAPAKAAPAAPAEAAAQAQLPATPPIRPAPPPKPASPSLYDELFEDPMGVKQSPIAAPEIEGLRREITSEYVNIHEKSYYNVLGVAAGAPPSAIEIAYTQRVERFKLERFAGKDLGPDYARIDEIIQIHRLAFDTLSSPERRRAYDEELKSRSRPATPRLDADLFAQEAGRLLTAGDAKGAVAKLSHAVALAPTEADYQALLAWATFRAEGQSREAFTKAEAHAKEALRINPDNALAHEYLGSMWAALGEHVRAFDSLGRAIDLDLITQPALVAFEALAAQTGEWKRLELRYRKTLHRLNDESSFKLQLDLWLKLGDLYQTKLSDPENARMAYSMMHQLAPDDPRPSERLSHFKE